MTSVIIDKTMKAINTACKSKGGVYKEYSCKTVSWDDVKRGNVGGNLSCWGANITDTYLKAKDGRRLFTVRSDNWNEKLGVLSSDKIALVQGNQGVADNSNTTMDNEEFVSKLFVKNKWKNGESSNNNNNTASSKTNLKEHELKPITLQEFLKNAKKYGHYAGLKTEALSDDILDKKCSVRFQTTFLPVDDTKHAKLEFATEAYNYNTRSDSDPRNLILLCTTQGLALQQDGAGTKRLFHHAVDEDNKIHRYWLEAEKSNHKVGGEQKETKEERDDAIARGKATSSVIGTKAMGTRFNVLMTVQIPLEQKPKPRSRGGKGLGKGGCIKMGKLCSKKKKKKSALNSAPIEFMDQCMDLMCANDDLFMDELGVECELGACMDMDDFDDLDSDCEEEGCKGMKRRRSGKQAEKKEVVGTANAARVSRGSEADVWEGLMQTTPKRNSEEHITVTIVLYFTISGGVPSEADVVAAIDDMEKLYNSCTEKGNLADDTFDFMKGELTVKDVVDMQTKIKFQPPSVGVTNHNVFPG